MLHPLALPEIIERIGSFLAWFHVSDDIIFNPNDLASCIRVNRIFYQTLTPLLWTVFRDDVAAEWGIPADSTANLTKHIRFAYLSQGPQLIPIHSTKLRHLTLSHQDRMWDALNLVCTNKQLTRLEWLAPFSSTRSPDKNLVRFALSTVTSLTSLALDCWRNSLLDDVIAIAQSNRNLQSLALGSLVNLKVERITNPGLLSNLTELRLDSHWGLNPGIEFLVRLCPRLETLWFRADSTCPYSTLSLNLWECCPIVASMKCVEGAKDAQCRNIMSTNDGAMSLVQAPHFLIHLEIPVMHLTYRMCDALLDRHANSLKSIRFYIRAADEEDFLCVNEILSRCLSLTSFALNDGEDHDCGVGASPMCYLEDDYTDEEFVDYDSLDEKDEQDANDGQDHQGSISEETTQDMDVDTDSQWTFDVVMENGEFKDDQKGGITSDKYKVYDPFMDIDPTPTELAFDIVLQLLEADSTHVFLDAFSDWLECLGWSLQTDVEMSELAIKKDHKRLLIELFECVANMPTMDQIVMGGVKAVKTC
ncbi:hypothetical protein BGZ92_007784 [Podila epicladia]|nr:hypothetical protein BGZ92_007784 [Podila epicladia]